MGTKTKIQWCDHTFSPWRGCAHVSAGCENCYAERMAKRNPKVLGTWGPEGVRVLATETYWLSPLAWDLAAQRAGERRRVFCGSLMDVFEDRRELDEARARLWTLVELTPHLDWLLLTKRPENAAALAPTWPANAWLGVSCEDQAAVEARVPALLRVPVAGRFLSCEPLLGPLDLSNALQIYRAGSGIGWFPRMMCEDPGPIRNPNLMPRVDWVIVGGESGPLARPMHPAWARSIQEQCQAAGVPFFFKAHGEWIHQSQTRADGMGALMHEAVIEAFGGGHGARKYVWPDGSRSYRVGRAASGETLDGMVRRAWPWCGDADDLDPDYVPDEPLTTEDEATTWLAETQAMKEERGF
jgi:protein gp37